MKVNVLLRKIKKDYFKSIGTGKWVGVDYGAYYLIKRGIIPVYAFGDFDSVSQKELNTIKKTLEIDIVPRQKDYTDFELSLHQLVDKGYREIDVYGAMGGRIDHEIANIQALVHPDFVDYDIRLLNEKNTVVSLNSGRHEVMKESGMHYVSIIPMYPDTEITLNGFEYDVEKLIMEIGKTLTVSNAFKHQDTPGIIQTDKPIILIQSRDKAL